MYIPIFIHLQSFRCFRSFRFYLILYKTDAVLFRTRQILMEDDIQKLSSQPHISLINHDRIITEFLFIFSRHIFHFFCQHFLNSFDLYLSTLIRISQRIEKSNYSFTVYRFVPRNRAGHRINHTPTITFQIITTATGSTNCSPIPSYVSN